MPSLTALLDTVTQAVIATDVEGRITLWNTHAERLFGWRRDEVLGHPIVEITPSLSQTEDAEKIMDRLRGGASWGGPFTVRHRTGYEFEAFVILAPVIEGGKLTGMIGISTPIRGSAQPETAMFESLTPRECVIARMTAEGKTGAEIAAVLGIGVRTVESHRANLYRKLGIRSRTELIFRSRGDRVP
jgi:PAS domain S-box-containing protein